MANKIQAANARAARSRAEADTIEQEMRVFRATKKKPRFNLGLAIVAGVISLAVVPRLFPRLFRKR